MKLSVSKKMGLTVFAATLVVGTVSSYFAYQLMKGRVRSAYAFEATEVAQAVVTQVQNEVDRYMQLAQVLGTPEYATRDAKKKFLSAWMRTDPSLIGITIWGPHYLIPGKWASVLQLNHREGDQDYVDVRYPLPSKTISKGKPAIVGAISRGGKPMIRIGVPIFPQKNSTPDSKTTTIVSFEIDQTRFQSRIHPKLNAFQFILDSEGRLLTQSSPHRYVFFESLSHLAIFQSAITSNQAQGQGDFEEQPGGKLRIGGFSKSAGLEIVSISEFPYANLAWAFTGIAAPFAMGICIAATLSGLLAIFFSYGWIGSRLARMRRAFSRIQSGTIPLRIAGKSSRDEFGATFTKLQETCDYLRKWTTQQGPMAKLSRIKDPEVLKKVESGQLDYAGEKTHAAVLHCHLHGLDSLAAKANAKKLLESLNTFNDNVCQAVEDEGGIIDHIFEGSIVAFWGVPVASPNDVHRAVRACMKIREHVATLNRALEKMNTSPVKAGLGLHYGTVVVGQLGTKSKKEYTAIGEPLEIASRIQAFGDEFGTDLLITEAAVKQAESNFAFERVTSGDDLTPALYELPKSA